MSHTTRTERLGPLGRLAGPSPQALVLGMHRSGTSALTSLLDRLGFHAGPDESLMPADEHNARGYWELGELQAINDDLLAALGGTWTDVLGIDWRRLDGEVRAAFVSRTRSLIGHLDSYGPWVIKDPRLCLLLPFWRELLDQPVCILIHRHPLAVARSLAQRDGLPILVGIALWEHYSLAALAGSRELPRALIGYRDLVDDPAGVASSLVQTLRSSGVQSLEALREVSGDDARKLLDGSLAHHDAAPGEELGYLNARQRELLHSLQDGSALREPVPELSPGARGALQDHARRARAAMARRQALADAKAESARSAEHERALVALVQELTERIQSLEAILAGREEAVTALEGRLNSSERERGDLIAELEGKRRELGERDALLGAVFSSRIWRLGLGLSRLVRALRGRGKPTAEDRWRSLLGG